MMAALPCVGEFSNVSIESSFYRLVRSSFQSLVPGIAHVERAEIRSGSVESVVVEFDELLWLDRKSTVYDQSSCDY
jgi:hypothetical protein